MTTPGDGNLQHKAVVSHVSADNVGANLVNDAYADRGLWNHIRGVASVFTGSVSTLGDTTPQLNHEQQLLFNAKHDAGAAVTAFSHGDIDGGIALLQSTHQHELADGSLADNTTGQRWKTSLEIPIIEAAGWIPIVGKSLQESMGAGLASSQLSRLNEVNSVVTPAVARHQNQG